MFYGRSEYGAFSNETRIVNNQLFAKPKNQRGFFHYPISDSVFVCTWKDEYEYCFTESIISFTSSGKAIRVRVDQWFETDFVVLSLWIVLE